MKLYEISAEMRRALHDLEIAQEAMDPKAYEEAMERISKLEGDKDKKLADCCAYYRELQAEVDGADAELERIKNLAENAQNRLDNWKKYIAICLGAGETWKNSIFKLSWRKSVAVRIENEEQIPPAYLREILRYEPDKKQIMADLKQGATIPGAVLEEKQNLQIS